jgi:hypothetical protein
MVSDELAIPSSACWRGSRSVAAPIRRDTRICWLSFRTEGQRRMRSRRGSGPHLFGVMVAFGPTASARRPRDTIHRRRRAAGQPFYVDGLLVCCVQGAARLGDVPSARSVRPCSMGKHHPHILCRHPVAPDIAGLHGPRQPNVPIHSATARPISSGESS